MDFHLRPNWRKLQNEVEFKLISKSSAKHRRSTVPLKIEMKFARFHSDFDEILSGFRCEGRSCAVRRFWRPNRAFPRKRTFQRLNYI